MNDNHTSEIDRGIRFGIGFAVGVMVIGGLAMLAIHIMALIMVNLTNPALYLIMAIVGTALLINGMIKRKATKG